MRCMAVKAVCFTCLLQTEIHISSWRNHLESMRSHEKFLINTARPLICSVLQLITKQVTITLLLGRSSTWLSLKTIISSLLSLKQKGHIFHIKKKQVSCQACLHTLRVSMLWHKTFLAPILLCHPNSQLLLKKEEAFLFQAFSFQGANFYQPHQRAQVCLNTWTLNLSEHYWGIFSSVRW